MPVPLNELQSILQMLIAEHEKMLGFIEQQQQALRKLNAPLVQELSARQESTRMRIGGLEDRRRMILQTICTGSKLPGQPTIALVAQHFPVAGPTLIALRDRLKSLAAEVSNRAQVAGRVAGALLGHLNTVVRLVAGVTEQARLYNKQGVHTVSSRISLMEAVA